MLRFTARKLSLWIEITASAMRLAVLSGRGANRTVLFTNTIELPDGVVSEGYATPSIIDISRLNDLLQECLSLFPSGIRRAALSLPDSMFRIQTLDFEEIPAKTADLERLIRWRIEKGSVFDISETVLRYQVLGRNNKGFIVLACVAKQVVIAQYEALLIGLGLEPWAVGPSSFHTWNFYSSYIANKSTVSALVHLSENSLSTIIGEEGVVRFYRYKDIKRVDADSFCKKFMREIDDSLHFYSHMNPARQTEVKDLYLTGDTVVATELAAGLRESTSLNVVVLSPALVVVGLANVGSEMASALGAGESL